MTIFNCPNILFSSGGWKCYKLRRLYFIWVCRDIESFRWFADLLCMLHDKVMGVAWKGYCQWMLSMSTPCNAIEKDIFAQNRQAPAVLLLGVPNSDSIFGPAHTNWVSDTRISLHSTAMYQWSGQLPVKFMRWKKKVQVGEFEWPLAFWLVDRLRREGDLQFKSTVAS